MKNLRALIVTLSTAMLPHLSLAADASKAKILDKFDSIDPKTVKLSEVKTKIVATKDPAHPKALELIADFAKPGWPNLQKRFPEGTISKQKFSGISIWARSNSSTIVNLQLRSYTPQPDGRPVQYYVQIPATTDWKEYSFAFSDFRNWEQKVWKDGVQKVFKGGEPILDSDYELFTSCELVFDINKRGTATAAHLMVDNLTLISK